MISMIENKVQYQPQYSKYKQFWKQAELGKARTRFCTSPTQYPTIAHAQPALLSYHYSKIYKGQMILRFSDNKPSLQHDWQVDRILEDLRTLKVKYTQLTYMSDYFDCILGYCRELIKRNLAYVDNIDQKTLSQYRSNKIQSACRNNSVETNLQIFQKMLKGEPQYQQYYLRAKINIQDHNHLLRDPPIYHPNQTPHRRTSKKYKIYPTYNFATPIIDHLQGINYVFRQWMFGHHSDFYWWVQRVLGFTRVEICQYGRICFQFNTFCSDYLRVFLEGGFVCGWDDPRIFTVRGLIRRGITVQALTNFVLERFPSRNFVMDMNKLWAFNKTIIDPISPRLSAVKLDRVSRLTIQNINQYQVITVSQHIKKDTLGERPLWIGKNILLNFQDAELLEVGEKVTLLRWGNIRIKNKLLLEDGSYSLEGQFLVEDRDFKKTKKIAWLAQQTNLVSAELIKYQPLLKVRTVQNVSELKTSININSNTSLKCLVDSNLRIFEVGQFIQLDRMAYYRIDQILKENDDFKYKLIYVPDGRETYEAPVKVIPKVGLVK